MPTSDALDIAWVLICAALVMQHPERRVDVIDALGRSVRTLLNERVGPGERSIVWDGRDARGPLPCR